MVPIVFTPGQNAKLFELGADPHQPLRVLLDHKTEGDADVDLSALLVDETGKVRSDSDFVFYNQRTGGDGSVRHQDRVPTEEGNQEQVSLVLGAVPSDVAKIVFAASVTGSTFSDIPAVTAKVSLADGSTVAVLTVEATREETVLVLVEVYRRGEGWSVRAVGQGYADGLAGLARDFGVDVDDTDSSEVTQEVAEQPAQRGESAEEGAPEGREDVRTSTVPAASRTRKQVQTAKPRPYVRRAPQLAEGDDWTEARLFSVDGIGSAGEQERRVTSALLSTMGAVKEFGRSIVGRLGGPAGPIEAYTEVRYPEDEDGEHYSIPDGVLKVRRANRTWTALLEVKTSNRTLQAEQVERYLRIAQERGYDIVVTVSNEIPPVAGVHPLAVDKALLRGVRLIHLSWAEVLKEARVALSHSGVVDPSQAWILSELVRYLEHPRSGAGGFEDMGPSWVPVRNAVANGTLRRGDRHAGKVVTSWDRLVQHLCLRLTSDLGADVKPSRRHPDLTRRTEAQLEELASTGCLKTTLKVPGAAGDVEVVADLRTLQVSTILCLTAPQDKRVPGRITWLLKQLGGAPDNLQVEVASTTSEVCAVLGDVRANPDLLTSVGAAKTFTLTLRSPAGAKRTSGRGGFVTSVDQAVDTFYSSTVQGLKAWTPPAPRLEAAEGPDPAHDE